jgi:hypothetical protein
LPKVIPGGVAAMHDTTIYPGANRAVTESILASSEFSAAANRESITYGARVEPNSWADKCGIDAFGC